MHLLWPQVPPAPRSEVRVTGTLACSCRLTRTSNPQPIRVHGTRSQLLFQDPLWRSIPCCVSPRPCGLSVDEFLLRHREGQELSTVVQTSDGLTGAAPTTVPGSQSHQVCTLGGCSKPLGACHPQRTPGWCSGFPALASPSPSHCGHLSSEREVICPISHSLCPFQIKFVNTL